jgi:FtsZ-binding cell division protein ZapB
MKKKTSERETIAKLKAEVEYHKELAASHLRDLQILTTFMRGLGQEKYRLADQVRDWINRFDNLVLSSSKIKGKSLIRNV